MRRPILPVLTLLALCAVAVAAEAQVIRERSRDGATRSFTFTFDGDSGAVRMFDSRRGRIGITVSLVPDRSRDSVGALVEDVVTRGPADRAGVRAGDLVVRWNDVRLAEGRDDDDAFRSRPGQRLINLAQRLEPGDTVRLEVQRAGRAQSFRVVADSADIDRIVERLRLPSMMGLRELGPGTMFGLPNEPRLRVMVSGPGGLGDVELVTVTPELAQGLGISEGLLVVNAGRDSSLGLRAGDVIMTIGGRRPSSPVHAMRILSTYEPGEAVQFEVMRQRRRQTVSGRMPRARAGEWRAQPNNFEYRFREPEELLLEPLMRLREDAPFRLDRHERPGPGGLPARTAVRVDRWET